MERPRDGIVPCLGVNRQIGAARSTFATPTPGRLRRHVDLPQPTRRTMRIGVAGKLSRDWLPPTAARRRSPTESPLARRESGLVPVIAKQLIFRYRVDARDRLVFVDPLWLAFARENGAADLTEQRVIGRSLWDFVADAETIRLYRELHARVRGCGARR